MTTTSAATLDSELSLNDILHWVQRDFDAINTRIGQHLQSNVPLVEKIADYIVSSGGKRIRPLLVLLASKALTTEEPSQTAIDLSVVIEFIHTATLLHDDVVDTSDMRRGNPTANAKWGNAPSVLVGDFLYSRAFQLMVALDNMHIMSILSHATRVIAEGEVLQLTNVRNPNLTETQYFETIYGKTAMLFEAATHTAAIMSQADSNQVDALRLYGKQLGLAFQLMDDVLDYEGDSEALGKNVGDDLAEGKPTLPLIHAMSQGTEQDAKLIKQAIRQGDLNRLDDVLAILDRTQSLAYTRSKAQQCVTDACKQLELLPDSYAKHCLQALAMLSVQRTN